MLIIQSGKMCCAVLWQPVVVKAKALQGIGATEQYKILVYARDLPDEL